MDIMAPEMAFQPDQGNILFADEPTAIRVLETDYRRHLNTLLKFADLRPVLKTPRRVLDLGCGAGVITLWLATLYPEAEVIGIDWSEGCIRMAGHFKQKLNLSNVSFHCGSYEDFGFVARLGKVSLAVNCHGTWTLVPDSDSDPIYQYKHLSPEKIRAISPAIVNSCKAMTIALEECGVGVLDLRWNPLGLLCLFQGLHEAALGIVWEHSRWSQKTGDSGGQIIVRFFYRG